LEYEWQKNVWDLGLGDLGATACSRFLFFPQWVFTNADYVWETGIFAAYQLPNTEDDPYLGFTGFGQPRMSFPYGTQVQPNVPV
jgi:hypothetical protein